MRILLVNVHSGCNLGDLAILQATLRGLREVYGDVQITVAVNHPSSLVQFPEIECLGSFTSWVERVVDGRFRGRIAQMPVYAVLLLLAALLFRLTRRRLTFGSREQRRLLEAYYEADLVLSCGGGYFFAYKPLSPFFVWALAALAFPLALGKRVVMLPQSIGPIGGRLNRALACQVLGRVGSVMLREPNSAAYLAKTLGVSRPQVVLPDLAFSLAAPCPLHPREEAGNRKRPRVGVTVIDWAAQTRSFGRQAAYEEALVGLLVRLSQRYDARVEVFSQSFGPTVDQDDRAAAGRLYDRLSSIIADVVLGADFDDPAAIMGAYSGLDLLIGSRMHAAILGLCVGVPVLVVGYQPKAAGMMALLGLERYCLDIEGVTVERLEGLALELLDDGGSARALIAERVARAQRTASTWTRYLRAG